MPFYETGRGRKNGLSKKELDLVRDSIQNVKPHQIFAAGDLSDPHGTHRICLEAVQTVLKEMKDEDWTDECYIWLYRGIWQDIEVSDIDMAVPLSTGERLKKRK